MDVSLNIRSSAAFHAEPNFHKLICGTLSDHLSTRALRIRTKSGLNILWAADPIVSMISSFLEKGNGDFAAIATLGNSSQQFNTLLATAASAEGFLIGMGLRHLECTMLNFTFDIFPLTVNQLKIIYSASIFAHELVLNINSGKKQFGS